MADERQPWTIQLCIDSQNVATTTAFGFDGLLKRNTGGDFLLETTPDGVPKAGYLDPEGLEPGIVPFDPRDVTDLRLIGEGRILFAGAVAGENGGVWIDRSAAGELWRIGGVELGWHRLASRSVYPEPTNEIPWSVEHDTRTGTASSMLAAYIEANAGLTAITGRQIPGLDVDDDVVGTSDTFKANAVDDLASLATRIGNDYGIEVIPEYDFDGTVTIHLAAARDFSGIAVFSDQGDLLKSEARFQARGATSVISGGSGTGTSRIFRRAASPATGAKRFEAFSDQGDLATGGEVQADASAALTAEAAKFQMTTTLTDSAAMTAIEFGLRVGDKVGIIARARRYIAGIEAVQLSVNAEDGQIMRPRFGAARPDVFRDIIARVPKGQLRRTV